MSDEEQEARRNARKESMHPANENAATMQEENIAVSDQFEMLTKFAMEQNLSHYGYGDKLQHLNKNILLTNLKREFNEPEIIRKLSRALTILSGHTEEHEIVLPTGEYEQIDENEKGILARPIYEVNKIEERRFKRLEIYIGSKIFAITGTAAGTNAVLLEKLKSTFIHKEVSMEDKTETKGGLWAKLKGKK